MKVDSTSPRIAEKWLFIFGLVLLFILALVLRLSLIKFQSYDYTTFLLPWYNYMHVNGFHAFHYNFSNYNLPYLYLLYIANLLHLPAIWAIKITSCLFDLLLAFGVFLLVRHYRNNFRIAAMAAVSSLFLPTIFLNSAAWGQCDSIYCSFVLLSLYSAVRNRSFASWAWWAVALCFKLQAIFFLPFLIFVWLVKRDGKWWHPAIAIPIFLAPFVPAMSAGRSFMSIASIYRTQAAGKPFLSSNAPNLYQWLNNTYFTTLSRAGVIFTVGIIVLLLMCAFAYRQRLTDHGLLALALLFLLIIPFALPQMHERYFYSAEVVGLVVAFTLPLYAWVAGLIELVGFFVYLPFLFRVNPPLPISTLALLQLFNICVVIYLVFYKLSPPNNSPTKRVKNT